MKNKLISEIWKYCKYTHNYDDLQDLHTMSKAELTTILDECIEYNK